MASEFNSAAIKRSAVQPRRSRSLNGLPPALQVSLRIKFVICFAMLCAVFLYFSMQPLYHTDLWDHVNYGRHFLDTRVLPQTEPLIELASNSPMTTTAWASQVIFAAIVDADLLGLPGLQSLFGLLAFTAVSCIGFTVLWRTQSLMAAILAITCMLLLQWQQLRVIRPQMFGVVGFSVLLAVLSRNRRFGIRLSLCIALMFAVWSNLHGSFAVGLTLIGTYCAGTFTRSWLRHRFFKAALKSPYGKRLALLTALCSLGALVNPNGYLVYQEVLLVGRHPNIATMYEWDALSLEMKQGKAFLAVCIVLIPLLWIRRRRVTFAEGYSLLLFLTLTIWSSRMICWFAPLAAMSLSIHAAEWLGSRQRRQSISIPKPKQRYVGWGLAAVLLLFTVSPLGQRYLFGRKPSRTEMLASRTPVEAADFIHDNLLTNAGAAFAPAEWAGYLKFRAPNFKPMVNLHVHLMPVDVWSDYLRLARETSGAEQILRRYGINLVVADRSRNGYLIRQLQTSAEFEQLHVDSQARVFRRRTQTENVSEDTIPDTQPIPLQRGSQ